jgi:SAM-dependent methyltransferase
VRRPKRHWFEDIADHAGEAYLRYSFTKGTEREIDFLMGALELTPGMRVLDVGCGPGRHAHALGRRGLSVVGVDISKRFIELARQEAPPGTEFIRGDARRLEFDGEFDAVISLCQGGFGLVADDDPSVLTGVVRALKPGRRAALSAFSAYFQVRFLEETDSFDAANGINHEQASVRNPLGEVALFDLWTTCFTPRELRLMVTAAGGQVDSIWSVSPGDYGWNPPDLAHPEWLVLLTRPH